jgi:hypothetical protein
VAVHAFSAYRRGNQHPFEDHLDSLRARLLISFSIADFWYST